MIELLSTKQADTELIRTYARGSSLREDEHGKHLTYTKEAQTAFTALVRQFEAELHSYLRRYLGNEAMARDVAQATWMTVAEKSHQFEDDKKFRPWLYTIATNQAIDAQRRNKRHQMLSLDRRNPGVDDEDAGVLADVFEAENSEQGLKSLIEKEDAAWLRTAVSELPDAMRDAVYLIYYQDLKYREAADALSIPVGTVKSRLHSAILKLDEEWQRYTEKAERPRSLPNDNRQSVLLRSDRFRADLRGFEEITKVRGTYG